MRFDLRGTVHLGWDVFVGGQVDSTKSTGDFVLSGGGLSQPLLLPMRSGHAYIGTEGVLHHNLRHGIMPGAQAALSLVCTWPPGRRVFHPFRSKSNPLADSFPLFCGVKAVDGEEAFEVTTTELVPPRRVKARIRQPGAFVDGVSLFRAPSEEQASAYYRLGTMHGATGGRIGGATLETGANQVGSAPGDGKAANARSPIPGAPDPAKAHGFCFGFGADGEVVSEKLKQLFEGEDGYGDGPITEGGCTTPNFSEAGVTKRKGMWQLDGDGCVIQGLHNGNATEGHPTCVIGGTAPVEKVNGSWRLCKWALWYVLDGKIVSRITHNERHKGAQQKSSDKKRAKK